MARFMFISRSFSVLFLLLAGGRLSFAQGTAFTYQGLLKASNAPANGTFDFRFILYNAAEGGSQVGITQIKEDMAVANGLVQTELNFGDIFGGDAVWLEVGVRPGMESGTFTTLSPRQPITSSPYSIRSLTAAQAESSETALTSGSATNFSGVLAGDVTGTQGATVVGKVGGAAAADVATGAALANGATDQNTPGTLVKRDQSGNFSTNQITAQTRLRVAVTGDSDFPSDILAQFRYGSPLSDKFRIDQGGGFVAINRLGIGIIPATGKGDRLMWHPFKDAFRAGGVDGDQWDDANAGFYSWAGGFNSIASSVYTFAFGDSAKATATSAVAIGSGAEATGSGSVAIGVTAKSGGLGSVALGQTVTANANNSIAVGRLASTNGKVGSIVFGDRSSINASTIVNAVADNQFVVRAQNIWLGKTSTPTATAGRFLETSTGAYLTNTGVWTNNSSRALKAGFSPVDTLSVLEKVLGLPIQTWSYISDDTGTLHMGPMAQDFYAAFGLGLDDEHITTVDEGGVALAAIQGLHEELKGRDKTIARLQDRLDAQEQKLKEQQSILDGLRKMVCGSTTQSDICR